jgi:hypothetical protein
MVIYSGFCPLKMVIFHSYVSLPCLKQLIAYRRVMASIRSRQACHPKSRCWEACPAHLHQCRPAGTHIRILKSGSFQFIHPSTNISCISTPLKIGGFPSQKHPTSGCQAAEIDPEAVKAKAQDTIKVQSALAGECTLWLCQNSYGKWQFIVSFPIKSGDFP